jgi:hypothetical protein
MTNATLTLPPDQVDFFHREGYLVLPAVTTADEVAGLCEIYDRLFATEVGRAEGDRLDLSGTDEDGQKAVLPQILNPSKYAPELAHTVYRANAASIAKQLLGPTAEYRGDHAIRKAAHSQAPTPWHQDEAYWNPNLDYSELSIWIPLQEATLKNGCMQFLPGTHRQEVLPHHPIGNDPRVIGLEVDDPRAAWRARSRPVARRCITAARCTTPVPTAPTAPGGPTFSRLAPRANSGRHRAASTGSSSKRLSGRSAIRPLRPRRRTRAAPERPAVSERPSSRFNPTDCLSRRRP